MQPMGMMQQQQPMGGMQQQVRSSFHSHIVTPAMR